MKTIHQAAILALLGLFNNFCIAANLVSIPSQDGKLAIPGYWFAADTVEPRPAIIALHGCGGTLDNNGHLSKNRIRDADYFNAENMHFLVIDSFTPRGQKSLCEISPSRRSIHEEDRREDVFAAMQWLARQPGVDPARIVVMGRSHGAQTALSVLDRTDKAVQAQTIQPRAVVALYPGCSKFAKMWNYELSAPLLLMIGEKDDWTPAKTCVELHEKIKRSQKDAMFELQLYPDSYHGFDGTAPVGIRTGLGGPRSGMATVGGNPAAREQAHRRMFDFLAAQLDTPLLLTHDERFKGHRYGLPPASGFAGIDDAAAVPLSAKGRARFQHYRTLEPPKAFVITEKKGWFIAAGDAQAMQTSLDLCGKQKCWLYAVDDRVVWQADVTARLDQAGLRRKMPSKKLQEKGPLQ